MAEPERARRLDGMAVAARMRAELAPRVATHLDAGGAQPVLAVLLVSDDPADLTYARHKERDAAETGIAVELVHLPASASQEEVNRSLTRLNADERVAGVLVQLPLPPHLDALTTISQVDPRKDVDGLSPVNLGLLVQGRPLHRPATARAAIELLRREGVDLSGQHVVIVGRSLLVARPLALLLAAGDGGREVSVSLTDLETPGAAALARQAAVLVAAVERPEAIGAGWVRPGATVVDPGLHWIDDPARESGRRLVGDVDATTVSEVAGAITPVPGGLGPMTTALLLEHTLEAARLRRA